MMQRNPSLWRPQPHDKAAPTHILDRASLVGGNKLGVAIHLIKQAGLGPMVRLRISHCAQLMWQAEGQQKKSGIGLLGQRG